MYRAPTNSAISQGEQIVRASYIVPNIEYPTTIALPSHQSHGTGMIYRAPTRNLGFINIHKYKDGLITRYRVTNPSLEIFNRQSNTTTNNLLPNLESNLYSYAVCGYSR